jgi:glucose-6-phosphate 1-dehydrogenase
MKTKLIIFGISGDLSRRKLLPALDVITGTGDFDDLEVIGVARKQLNAPDLLSASFKSLGPRISIFSMDLAELKDYRRLKAHLSLRAGDQALLYLSVPPVAARQIVQLLGDAGFAAPNVKLLLEKPFGTDLVSAEAMNQHIHQHFKNEQVYRIDHYLAKEMAQNIVAFRAGNALFSHVWGNHAIESIEVIATETIGIEGRGQFYEQTGALRDVLQGHLMQLLALVLMEAPSDLNWETLPRCRLEALRHLHSALPQESTRAQYEGYPVDAGNPGSRVETFASVVLSSADPNWRGVPFRLVAGKALDAKTTEIHIDFKRSHAAQHNRLTFRIQPNEGVEIELFAKKPGYQHGLETRHLALKYPADIILPDAYEQVLVDAIRSQKSLFTSGAEVLESWRVLQPIVDAWEMSSELLYQYKAGSSLDIVKSQG